MRMRKFAGAAACVFLFVASAWAAEFTKGPYLISVTETSATVGWEVDKAGRVAVEYGAGGNLDKSVKAKGEGQFRKIVIGGLEPAVTYSYRVKEGEAESAVYTFRTLVSQGEFTFAVYGDTRTNPLDHEAIAKAIAGCAPLFVLHTGDLVENGKNDSQWEPQFFGPAASLISKVPVFTVAGNHERESENYYRYFGQASGRPWYSFDCVNAHFAMLNSCIDLAPDSEQYRWLNKDLAGTDKRWRIVAFHHPLYSSSSHGGDAQLRAVLEPVFQKHNVDIVFAGHDHTYERTYPIVSAVKSVHPITYVVAGGGGAPRYEITGDFFSARYKSTLNYCIVRINGDRLDFAAYDEAKKELDAFEIAKSGEGYTGGYLARTAPVELASVEEAVKAALGDKTLTVGASPREERIEYKFAAPEWGELGLSLEWRNPEKGAKMVPEKITVVIPAGETRKVEGMLKLTPGELKTPDVIVTGKTKLGEFKVEVSPFGLKSI